VEEFMKVLENKKRIDKMIMKASNIFVVGHRHFDLDAIASNIGIVEYVKSFNKKPIIIINDKRKEAGVNKILDKVEGHYHFEKSSKIKYRINDESLLIITDTNKEMLLQDPSIVSLFKNIIIIDHHEYNETSISKALVVVDDKVSSASEMVTYLLNEKNIKISSDIATVLLSGIVLDTNNFAIKTSKETFYAAYLLSSLGADENKVQSLLKQDIKDYIERSKILLNVKIVDNVAITVAKASIIYRREDLARVADILLQFHNIEASIVIGKIENNKIGISGRSIGKLNIGDVLEFTGGGGNAYEAASQISGSKLREVEDNILEILKKFK
jgi:c-di-AMP phosphodiesterase-like protein